MSSKRESMKKELLNAFCVGDVERVKFLTRSLPQHAKSNIPMIVKESRKYPHECAPLIAAIKYGNYHMCKSLIETGVSADFLIMALQGRRYDIAKLLIASGAECVNTTYQKDGVYPMYFAIINFSPPSIVEQIILAGFPVDKPIVEAEHLTAIQCTAFRNSLETAKVLVKHKANLNTATVRGDSALTVAVKGNHFDMVKFLVSNGADLQYREVNGCPLFIAINTGRFEMVRLLLDLGASVSKGWFNGKTTSPLIFASNHLNINITKLLIDRGAEVNPKVSMFNDTPLHAVFRYVGEKYSGNTLLSVQTKIAEALIEKGADINVVCGGISVLDRALYSKNTELCKLLVQEGADLTKYGLINGHLTNLFDYIVCVNSFKCPELIKLCLERGCNYNYRDRRGLTPYHCAMVKHNPKMLKVFWKYGCPFDQLELFPGKMKSMLGYNPDAADKNILAVQADFINGIISNNVETVRRALDEGAEPRGCSVKIPSTLHYAAAKGQYEIAKLLLENGVPANRVMEDQTPLNIAAEKNNIHLCSILLQFGACYNYKKTTGDKIIKTLEEGCKHLYSLFKIVYHMFRMAKEGNVRLLTYLKQCVNAGNIGLVKVLMNCVNRQGMSLSETALVFGHTQLFKDLVFLRIKHI